MSTRLIQDLHAGISRRDWSSVETSANRLRDEVEKTVAVLAGTGIGSLPNDYPLFKLVADILSEAERAARNVALDEAARMIESVAHKGLHSSMWERKFSAVASRIRSLQSEE